MFRWITLAVFVTTLGVSAFFRARARREGGTIGRGEETPFLIVLRLLFTLPLFLAIVAYLVNPVWMAWSSVAVPDAVRWIGTLIGFGVIPLAIWVFRNIGRNISETVLTKATHELVTTGPYRWVRHPLYTVGTLLLTAISLLAANWFIGGITILVVVMILGVVIPREEANLIDTFGDAYRAYRQQTGRLLPRLRSPR